MDYMNFDLRIGDWNAEARSGVVEVLWSPAGEGQRLLFLLDVDVAAHATRVRRTPSMVAELGRTLTNAVLSRQSLMLWRNSYQIASSRGVGLRLRLHIDSWELSRLPWELMYDVNDGDFFVFDPHVSIVRYLRLPATPPTLSEAEHLKLLVAVASPLDQPQLAWEEELASLSQGLKDLVIEGALSLNIREHVTRDSLQDALAETQPDVVHYIGHAEYDHGRRQGFLALEDENGRADRFLAQDAARILRRYGTDIVVLNSCDTAQGAWAGLAPALMRLRIAAVVAMQWQVEDRAAMLFSRGFYKALAQRRTIDECVAEGRLRAHSARQEPSDWAAPVLFMRSSSGRLWRDLEAETSHARDVGRIPVESEAPSTIDMSDGLQDGQEDVLFKTHGPLLASVDQDLIIDRPEFRRALRIAQQPSVTQYIAILGGRQTGKTTVLLNLMSMLENIYPCVFLDLSILRAQDARACFRSLAFQLLSELRSVLGQDILIEERIEIETPIDFLTFMRELANAVPLPRIVILIDEVGALMPQVSDTVFNALRTIFTQGRGLGNDLAKYLFVFGGAIDLSELTRGNNSPLNICEKLYLQDFELGDVDLIVHQFRQLNVRVSRYATETLYSLAHGHPYLTMRLCYLMERAQITKVTAKEIEQAAQEILISDDNIRHVIRKVDERPAVRRRLTHILNGDAVIPFSRNEPTLATLEMIGVVRATQPCQIRNELYARALTQYLSGLEGRHSAREQSPASRDQSIVGGMYQRLLGLRQAVLTSRSDLGASLVWVRYAEALFATVPAFSASPGTRIESNSQTIVVAIDSDRKHTEYWASYQPKAMITCRDLSQNTQDALANVAAEARRHDIRLVFVMDVCGSQSPHHAQLDGSGTYGDVYVVELFDADIKKLLDAQQDVDAFLRKRVFDARLRIIDPE